MKRFEDGGVVTGNLNYPFGQSQMSSAAPVPAPAPPPASNTTINVGSKLAEPQASDIPVQTLKRGGKVKRFAEKKSASNRADGIAQRGKTKGRYL